MGESALSANLWKLPACRGTVDMSEGRAVTHRDQDKLEEWVARSLTKLSKGKCEVLCWAWKNPLQLHKVEVNGLKSSFVERDLGSLWTW